MSRGERSETFQRGTHRRGAGRGEGGCFASHYTSPRSRGATSNRRDLTKQATETLFFRLEAGSLPSYVAGCPLSSPALPPGALPIPTAPPAAAAAVLSHPSRPRRQGQPWHCPSPRPGSPSGHISRSRPAPHQSLDEWTRAGRARRALGSAGTHPQ